MSDLDTLIPQSVELVIDGEPLAIKPLKVGQMPGFLRCSSCRKHSYSRSSVCCRNC